MLKKLFVCASLSAFLITTPAIASGSSQAATALDGAALLAAGADHQEILERLLFANTRVEPEYLGVAFHNSDTGARLDRQEIRELMGPVRQDGSYQLLAMAVEFSGHQLPYTREQLELLLDAAFMASMRRPPSHISIEYYDTRTGPTGVGGGVSGRVPESSPAASSQTEPEQAPQPSAEVATADYMPNTEEGIKALFERLNISATKRQGQVVMPLIVGASSPSGLDQALAREIASYENQFGVRFVESVAELREKAPSGVARLVMAAYFSGSEAQVQALESDIDGFFY